MSNSQISFEQQYEDHVAVPVYHVNIIPMVGSAVRAPLGPISFIVVLSCLFLCYFIVNDIILARTIHPDFLSYLLLRSALVISFLILRSSKE